MNEFKEIIQIKIEEVSKESLFLILELLLNSPITQVDKVQLKQELKNKNCME